MSALACCKVTPVFKRPIAGKTGMIVASQHALLGPHFRQRQNDVGIARETQRARNNAHDLARNRIDDQLFSPIALGAPPNRFFQRRSLIMTTLALPD